MARTIAVALKLENEAEYRAALKNSTAELRNLRSELDRVSSEYRNNANSMEALTAKSRAINDLYEAQSKRVSVLAGALEKAEQTRAQESRAIDEVREKYEAAKKALAEFGDEIDESNEGYQQAKSNVAKLQDEQISHEKALQSASASVDRYKTQLNRAYIELDKLDDQQAENARLMEEARQSADNCATSIDRYGNAVSEAAEGTGQSASAVEALSAALVAGGIQQKVSELAGTLMECSEAASEFELSLAKVGTIADNSILSQGELKAGILEMSSALGIGAGELSEAAYQALSAGVDTANVLNFTRQATELSVAGFTNAASAVDVLSTVINAYGLSSSDAEAVASKLVKTQDLGKITVDELAKSLGRVIPSAAAYGVNLDNIATAYANMTASGINAENATTYIATMLDELADNGSKAATILQEQTGKSFAELMRSGTSLGDVLNIIAATVNNDKEQFSGLWSSATAGRAALSLFNSGAEKFNSTLDAMANSSGSVAANYAKLADTSDFASRRMEVASANLKIAVGEQLNPILDKLRNAGAGILETATRIVSESPALVAVISGVVTALGLLAAGLSALMIVKAVTAAMAALNVTLAANPIGLVVVAITGLVAAIATFVSHASEAKQRMDELTEASRNLSDTVAESNQSYEDSILSATAAATAVEGYVRQLQELEQQGLDTNASQLEYQMIVDKINEVMPGLNVEIDEQTHLVKGGTAALLAHAESWKKNALAEAAYARYKDDLAAMADAEYELAKNTAQLNMVETEAKEISQQLEEKRSALAEAEEKLQWIQEGGQAVTAEQLAGWAQLQATADQLEGEIYDLEYAYYENKATQDEFNEAIDINNQAIEENKGQVEIATEAYMQFQKQAEEISGSTTGSMNESLDSVSDSLAKTGESYDELLEKARNSLDGQVGLFDKIDQKSKLSTDDMLANLRSQREAFDNYATNIQTAMERGIDIGLVQKLSDGSVESMQTLAELATATDEQVEEINKAFREKLDAQDSAAEAMAGVESAFNDGIAETAKSVYSEAEDIGTNMVNGAVYGIDAHREQYRRSVARLAEAGVDQWRRSNQQHSPSKRYRQLAEYDVQGLIVQYKADTPKLTSAVKDMADASYIEHIRARKTAATGFVTAAQTSSPRGLPQIMQLLQKLLDATNAGKVIALDSGALVGHTADKYNAAFGNLKFLTDRGAI